MTYTREDYEELYGDHWVMRSSRRTRLMVLLILVGWIAAMLFVTGCTDAQDAANAAQAEREASERVQLALGMPCTWVCQKYHRDEPCGQQHNTRCVKGADRSQQ